MRWSIYRAAARPLSRMFARDKALRAVCLFWPPATYALSIKTRKRAPGARRDCRATGGFSFPCLADQEPPQTQSARRAQRGPARSLALSGSRGGWKGTAPPLLSALGRLLRHCRTAAQRGKGSRDKIFLGLPRHRPKKFLPRPLRVPCHRAPIAVRLSCRSDRATDGSRGGEPRPAHRRRRSGKPRANSARIQLDYILTSD